MAGHSSVLIRAALGGQEKPSAKRTSEGSFLPRNRQGGPWFAGGVGPLAGLQVPWAGREAWDHPTRRIPLLAWAGTEIFPARCLLLVSSSGGLSERPGGRWEAAEKPKSSEIAGRNLGSASSQFRDVSLPAFLKPEPFPPRHISLEGFLLFLPLSFFFLLLPLFLLCCRGDLPWDGMRS